MRAYLAFSTFLFLLERIAALHVLLFSDSVDREGVVNWCTNFAHSTPKTWPVADPQIGYGTKQPSLPTANGGFFCESSLWNISISHVMIMGSNPHPPYSTIAEGEKYTLDTLVRINIGIQNYCENFIDAPDIILFHSTFWDFAHYHSVHDAWVDVNETYPAITNTTKNHILTETRHRLQDIINATHTFCKQRRKTYFILRSMVHFQEFAYPPVHSTGPSPAFPTTFPGNDPAHHPHQIGWRNCWPHRGAGYMNNTNAMIAQFAQDNDITFFDLDRSIWSTVQYDELHCASLFKDGFHPADYLSSLSIHKLLGLRYSTAYEMRGEGFQSVLPTLILGKDNHHSSYHIANIFRRILLIRAPFTSTHNSSTNSIVYFVSYHRHHHPHSMSSSSSSSSYSKEENTVQIFCHLGMTSQLISGLALGDTDIYTAKNELEWREIIPSNTPLPDWISQVVLNSSKALVHNVVDPMSHADFGFAFWFLEGRQRRPLVGWHNLTTDADSIQQTAYLLDAGVVLGPEDHMLWDYLELFIPAPAFLPVYEDGKLFRIGKQRQCWVFMNNTRRAIGSADVMYKYHWEWSQIVSIDDSSIAAMIERIPVGPTLTT